jgi:hypothetical protein
MTKKKQATKTTGKARQEKQAPVQGHWPDPHSREEISQADSQIDAGKHSKNPDWKKKW